MPSSFVPSADGSLPSIVPDKVMFGTVMSPVKLAPDKEAKPVPDTYAAVHPDPV